MSENDSGSTKGSSNTASTILLFLYYGFGIYFLVIDQHVGGRCANSEESKQVWVFCIVSLILYTILYAYPAIVGTAILKQMVNDRTQTMLLLEREKELEGLQRKLMNRFAQLLVIIGLLETIYGAVVLYIYPPCRQFRGTGLWTWALLTFWILAIGTALSALFLIKLYCWSIPDPADVPAQVTAYSPPIVMATVARSAGKASLKTTLPVSTPIPTGPRYLACHHWDSSFHLYFHNSEQTATLSYQTLLGSKVLLKDTTLIRHSVLNENWLRTVEQYARLAMSVATLSQTFPGDPPQGYLFEKHSICVHLGQTEGFYCKFYETEQAARDDCASRKKFFDSYLIGKGKNVIIESWSINSNWEGTVKQYWEKSIERQVLEDYRDGGC